MTTEHRKEYRESILIGILINETIQLRKWAEESVKGGWSTHQVHPMLNRADFIEEQLNGLVQGYQQHTKMKAQLNKLRLLRVEDRNEG